MTDAYAVFKFLEPSLESVPGLGPGRVFTGSVKEPVPTVGTTVLPYVVLWPGSGSFYEERPVSQDPVTGGLTVRFTTTVAGGEIWALLGTIKRVQAHLSGLAVGSGVVRAVTLQQEAATVSSDTGVTPSRLFIPLAWTLQTNTNPE